MNMQAIIKQTQKMQKDMLKTQEEINKTEDVSDIDAKISELLNK